MSDKQYGNVCPKESYQTIQSNIVTLHSRPQRIQDNYFHLVHSLQRAFCRSPLWGQKGTPLFVEPVLHIFPMLRQVFVHIFEVTNVVARYTILCMFVFPLEIYLTLTFISNITKIFVWSKVWYNHIHHNLPTHDSFI